ncbi:Hypothetical predicted protein, partial [Paramuricea clavata]
MHNDLGQFGFKKTSKRPKISFSGHKWHLKLRIGAEGAKRVSVEGIQYRPKSATPINFYMPPGRIVSRRYRYCLVNGRPLYKV